MISVVVPVYNAEPYIERAVRSVLPFDVITEILLVEDGSTDRSLPLCVELAEADPRIKLVQHEGGVNRGAGATRNLGLRKAAGDLIAFLDADDYYLENRFEVDLRILREVATCSGIYNAIGVHYYSDSARESFRSKGFGSDLTSVSEPVPGSELPLVLLNVHPAARGHFHLDGLTIRRQVIERVGYFDERLRLHQDSEWMFRLAYLGDLMPGSLATPVAVRGVHDQNRITSDDNGLRSRKKQFEVMADFVRARGEAGIIRDVILMRDAYYQWKTASGPGRYLALARYRGLKAKIGLPGQE